MKNNKTKEIYTSLEMEIVDVTLEAGYALSSGTGTGESWTDGGGW